MTLLAGTLLALASALPTAQALDSAPPSDLRPLCVAALGAAEPTENVDACVLRLESLRVVLPVLVGPIQ